MRPASWAFLAFEGMLLIVLTAFCGSIISVGGGKVERLNQNYDLCIIIIGIMVGIGVLGWFLLVKEKSSVREKNKLVVDKINDVYDNKGKKTSISKISTTNKKRLPPTKETVKELLKKSGNKCNFYPCHNVIIDYQGYLQGHVVSIMSNEGDQPNYNPKLSNEDRIKIDNLMLLCHDHYFDLKLRGKHTIETLIAKKIEAEESPNKDQTFQINNAIIEELIQGYNERYL